MPSLFAVGELADAVLRRVGGGGDATCKDVYAQHSLCSMARALWSMVGGPNLNQENAEW